MATVHHDIEQMTQFVVAASMEPKEFCEKWVTHLKPGDWGYFKTCVEELAKVTSLSWRTVEKWGPDFRGRPETVLVTLDKEDKLREIQKVLQPTFETEVSPEDADTKIIEPWDYCQCWLKLHPDNYSYRTECVKELTKATFGQYLFDTINRNWGLKFEKRPEAALSLIRVSHQLKLLQQKALEIDVLRYEPLEPKDFCSTWIPTISDKKPNNYGYRKECRKFLADLTGYEENSVDNWLSTPESVPKLARQYLRALDLLWKIRDLIVQNRVEK